MKIRAHESLHPLEVSIDSTANPLFIVYTAGDPRENPESFGVTCAQMSPAELRSIPPKKAEIEGFPTFFAVAHHGIGAALLLWPKPDKEYYTVFQYNPPRQQI